MKKSELNKILSDIRKSSKTTVTKGQRKSSGDPNPGGDTRVEITKENISVAKYLRGIVFGKWDNASDEERLAKAYNSTLPTQGGVFAPPQVSANIIEALREDAVIRNLNPMVETVPTGTTSFPAVTDTPTVSWGGENTTISEDTSMDFGERNVDLKRAQCLAKLSREWIERATADVESLVRAEMAKSLALAEDNVFLEGPGGTRPRGIYFDPRVHNTDLSGAVGLDNMKDALYQVRNTNADGALTWVMHPRTENDLSQLKDANGNYLIRDAANTGQGVTLGQRSILGYPLRTTTEISIDNKPGSSESYIVLGRWSDFVIGEQGDIQMEATKEGDAFTSHQVWVKMVRYVGCMPRYPEAFALIKGIQTT